VRPQKRCFFLLFYSTLSGLFWRVLSQQWRQSRWLGVAQLPRGGGKVIERMCQTSEAAKLGRPAIIPFAFAWTYEGAELHPPVLAIRLPTGVEWHGRRGSMQSSPFSGNVRHGPRILCGDLPQYRATCDPPSSLAKSRRFLNEWNGNCCSKLLTFGIRTAAAPQSESPVMRGSLRVRIHYNSQTFTNGSRSRSSGARGWGAWETPGN